MADVLRQPGGLAFEGHNFQEEFLKMITLCHETSGTSYPVTRPHIPQELTPIIPLWKPKEKGPIVAFARKAGEENNVFGENGKCFELLTVVTMKTVLLHVAPCILLEVYRRFRETCRRSIRVVLQNLYRLG